MNRTLCARQLFSLRDNAYAPERLRCPDESTRFTGVRTGIRSGGKPEIAGHLPAVVWPEEHINVGYSCHDPKVLQQQIASAKELNISGFVVNWCWTAQGI